MTHELGDDGMTFREDVFDRIRLRERVFVGAGAVIGPGVEIGRGTVVAAGATVTRDIGSEKIVLGSPPTQRVAALREWLTD